MGALHINGQKATGLNITLADGVFIDADNLIDQGTFTGTMSYTATEDCAFIGGISQAPATPGSVEIDGVSVYSGYMTNTTYVHNATFLLKAGQTITLTSTQAGWSNSYAVYGIQQGTIEGKLQPVIYSLEEREIGVWTNGKPLYQKTVEINNIAFDTSWHNVAHGISNIDEVISCVGILFGADGEFFNLPQYRATTSQGITFGIQGSSSEYIAYINNWYDGVNKIYATLQYTKTTDQAGAGTWTPDGAYAHHYSTDEKVVGTWIDGKTIYEKTTAISITITNADTFYNTGLSANGIDTFIGGTIIDIRNQSFPASVVRMNNDADIGISIPNGNRDTTFLTYQYTKTS